MYKNLLLTLIFAVPFQLLAQNASVSVNYSIPIEVEYGEDLDVQVQLINDGTVDVDSDVFLRFYVDTEYPTTFPPAETFSVELDIDDLEPGEQESDDLEIETDDASKNFTAAKQNIVTIWPKISGNDGTETFEYFFAEIEVIDNDAQPTSISIKEIPQIAIAPNPASNFVNLELPAAHAAVRLNVFSTFGQQVIAQDIQSEENVTLNVENLPAGIYIANIRDKDNKVIYWGRFSKIETR